MSKEPTDKDVEKVWQEFWVPVLYPAGYESVASDALDLEQVKRELYDFKRVMDEVDKVYIHVTGGKFSKCLTPAQWIIDAADEHYEKMWSDYNKEVEEALAVRRSEE